MLTVLLQIFADVGIKSGRHYFHLQNEPRSVQGEFDETVRNYCHRRDRDDFSHGGWKQATRVWNIGTGSGDP
jgi:hypothetical protein